ncbi:MAG: Crp/Fnr family transcriptional regulator [Ktedonobacterales bacterium]|nr:Crp/Fnr family transcriptional regulator [Ktedonobacterales bacterium]
MPLTHEQLRLVPLFAGLVSDDLTQIATISRVRAYSQSTLIILEGDDQNDLYFVLSGVVRIFKTSAEGKEQTLRLLHQGQTFNDVPALDGGLPPASAAALEPCDILITNGQALRRLIAEHASIGQAAVQVLTQALRHMVGLVEDLSFRHVTARVAKILLEQDALMHTQPHTHRFTQQEIAAQAGTAREMVGRALKELEAAGAITMQQGRPTIVQPDYLRMLAL